MAGGHDPTPANLHGAQDGVRHNAPESA